MVWTRASDTVHRSVIGTRRRATAFCVARSCAALSASIFPTCSCTGQHSSALVSRAWTSARCSHSLSPRTPRASPWRQISCRRHVTPRRPDARALAAAAQGLARALVAVAAEARALKARRDVREVPGTQRLAGRRPATSGATVPLLLLHTPSRRHSRRGRMAGCEAAGALWSGNRAAIRAASCMPTPTRRDVPIHGSAVEAAPNASGGASRHSTSWAARA